MEGRRGELGVSGHSREKESWRSKRRAVEGESVHKKG